MPIPEKGKEMFIILVECIVRYGQDISFEQVSYPYIKYFEKNWQNHCSVCYWGYWAFLRRIKHIYSLLFKAVDNIQGHIYVKNVTKKGPKILGSF